MAAKLRLDKEFDEICAQSPPGVSAGLPDENNLFVWSAILYGPQHSPYEGGIYKVELRFSEEYPAKPPTAKFVSPMFHPNVYSSGNICLDLLDSKWSESLTPKTVLYSILCMLGNPNPDSPANGYAAHLYLKSREEFTKQVNRIKNYQRGHPNVNILTDWPADDEDECNVLEENF